MARDTRGAISEFIYITAPKRSIFMVFLAICIAFLSILIPEWMNIEYFQKLPGLTRLTMAIVVFGAFLWMTEAIPAYSVSLLIIGCNIFLLSYIGVGEKGFNFLGMGDVYGGNGEILSAQALDFSAYLAPWASNLMWLFIAGFVLAHALSTTKLDIVFARHILKISGTKPMNVLLGSMIVTFILSMFMSNTATAAMMIALMISFTKQLPDDEPFSKALLLGIPVAANLGGIGTIIGTPPNGIVVENLAKMAGHQIDFASWMVIGLPVALALFFIGFVSVYFLNKPKITHFEANFEGDPPLPEDATEREIAAFHHKKIQQFITLCVFMITVLLWLTGKIHGISTYVISLIPIIVLGVTSVVDSQAFRKLPWDVLMLLAGGLSMGVAVKATGLDLWFGGLVPATLSPFAAMVAFSLLALVMSNLMSNTVTAAILIPIAIPIFQGILPEGTNVSAFVIPMALTCSVAMLLPISTPPNAVSFASGRLRSADFLKVGLIMAVAGPIVSIFWTSIASNILGF